MHIMYFLTIACGWKKNRFYGHGLYTHIGMEVRVNIAVKSTITFS
jgi:hypothetical protein